MLLNIVPIDNFLNSKHTNSTGTKSKYKQMGLRENNVSVHEGNNQQITQTPTNGRKSVPATLQIGTHTQNLAKLTEIKFQGHKTANQQMGK